MIVPICSFFFSFFFFFLGFFDVMSDDGCGLPIRSRFLVELEAVDLVLDTTMTQKSKMLNLKETRNRRDFRN